MKNIDFDKTKERVSDVVQKGEEGGNCPGTANSLTDGGNEGLTFKTHPGDTGNGACIGKEDHPDGIHFLEYLQDFINKRRKEMPKNSYITRLFESGINKIAQKVGEEAVELVIEAKDQNDELFLNEAADLMYHFLVLLSARGYSLKDVAKVLSTRNT